MDEDFYMSLLKVYQDNLSAALCTVVESKGSTPRKAGAKMIVFPDKENVIGSIGGGNVEFEVIKEAKLAIVSGESKLVDFKLSEQLQMLCGGEVKVFIEPIAKIEHLYIFGGGHVGRALAETAVRLGFIVTVFDPRKGIFTGDENYNCINTEYNFNDFDEFITYGKNSYFAVVTNSHDFDEQIVARLCRKHTAYLGVLGSVRKSIIIKENLKIKYKFPECLIEKIDIPMGIKFAAETPEEIAVSICAKLIDVRNRKSIKNSLV